MRLIRVEKESTIVVEASISYSMIGGTDCPYLNDIRSHLGRELSDKF